MNKEIELKKIRRELKVHIVNPVYYYVMLLALMSTISMAILKVFGLLTLGWWAVTMPIWLIPASFIVGLILVLGMLLLAVILATTGGLAIIVFLAGSLMMDMPVFLICSSLYRMGLIKKCDT